MPEEVDGADKAILRGYTMLALYILKEYVDECKAKNRPPKDMGLILKYCGREDLADRISSRLMNQ